MSKVLFISEKQVKELSPIETNVDSKVLSRIIQNVQETQLKAILKDTLYDALIEEVYKSATEEGYVLSTDHKALLEKVTPFLVYATLCDFIVLGSFKLSNKGTLKLTDNSASNSTPQDAEYLKNYYDNYLSQYKQALIDYLHSKDLLASNADTDITSSAIGWYLESRRPCSCTSSSSTS